jgi:hypothetical protein
MSIFQGTATSGGDGDFEVVPAGNHGAQVFALIDLGTHEESYQGKEIGKRRKCFLVWWIPGEEKFIGKEFTLSFGTKSNLRKMMESLRGRPYQDGESVDVAKILGLKCMLNVTHAKSRNDKTYAKVDGVSQLPKGKDGKPLMQVQDCEYKPFLWEIGGEDFPEYEWLPWTPGGKIADVISTSEEMKQGHVQQPPANGNGNGKKPSPPPQAPPVQTTVPAGPPEDCPF